MAIYRSDQSQLTFGVEAAQGGYPERSSNAHAASGTVTGDIVAGGFRAGFTYIKLDNLSNTTSNTFATGDYIQIGYTTVTTKNSEVRKVEFAEDIEGSGSSATRILRLDAPLGFRHEENEQVRKISGALTDESDGLYLTNIPGIYEIVDLPDPQMTITPAYFLGTDSKRNFNRAYAGQQNYSGSLPNMVLLNATPIRFPFGKIISHPTGASGANYLNYTGTTNPTYGCQIDNANGASKGDIFVTVDNADNGGSGTIPQNAYLVFTGSTTHSAVSSSNMASLSSETRNATTGVNCEIRKHIGSASDAALKLDKPLQFDHIDDEFIYIIFPNANGSGTAISTESQSQLIPYTHIIRETVDLDSISWHAHMKSSNEDDNVTSTHNFDRRYFGGKVGNATISAEEGGMVMMSWEDVAFMGMVHNQYSLNALHANAEAPFYAPMQPIESDDITQPTTEPYYFSQGEVTFAGMEIARLRSFNLSVSNSIEPRYYITKRVNTSRKGPSEIREQRREYSMSATLALPDTKRHNQTWTAEDPAATAIFQELLFEGEYGSGRTGFVINLTFTRASGDTLTIKIPDGGSVSAGNNAQGAFIRSATHNITTDGPLQVEADIMFRNLQIEIADKQYYYP